MNTKDLYKDKNGEYYSHVRNDLIPVLTQFIAERKNYSCLDVGCGSCDTLIFLKENGYISVADGIELISIAHSNQQHELLDGLWLGPIEEQLDNIDNSKYDIILCLDVLEHLVDPWNVIKALANKLKPGGYIIVSCPNIREIKTIFKIFVKGTFEYAKAGILDETHLRFFCPEDLKSLVENEKLEFVKLIPNYKMAPNRGKFRGLHFHLLDTIFAPQYFCVSRKKFN